MQRYNNPSGFTFVEAAMVIAILFVLAYLILQRIPTTSTVAVEGAVSQVAAYLRYIQATAMSTQQQTGVSFGTDSGGWYFLIEGQKNYLPQGVGLTLSGTIRFNSLGEPIPPIGTITVGGSVTLSVRPVTGTVLQT